MRWSATPFFKGKGRTRRPLDAGALLSGTTPFTCCCAGDPECLMAFLDDIYLVSQPERTAIAHRELGHQLRTRAGISLHAGKTQIWNKSGRCPPGCEGIFEAAIVADPNAMVWKGDQTLPTDQQGVVVLGAPLGHAHFITRILLKLNSFTKHSATCCCRPILKLKWVRSIGFFGGPLGPSDDPTWANFGKQN